MSDVALLWVKGERDGQTTGFLLSQSPLSRLFQSLSLASLQILSPHDSGAAVTESSLARLLALECTLPPGKGFLLLSLADVSQVPGPVSGESGLATHRHACLGE